MDTRTCTTASRCLNLPTKHISAIYLLIQGYLRLGKISRLQKKNEFAWKVYTAGIEVGNKHRLAESPKFQVRSRSFMRL
jgi:hypothetical protein